MGFTDGRHNSFVVSWNPPPRTAGNAFKSVNTRREYRTPYERYRVTPPHGIIVVLL